MCDFHWTKHVMIDLYYLGPSSCLLTSCCACHKWLNESATFSCKNLWRCGTCWSSGKGLKSSHFMKSLSNALISSTVNFSNFLTLTFHEKMANTFEAKFERDDGNCLMLMAGNPWLIRKVLAKDIFVLSYTTSWNPLIPTAMNAAMNSATCEKRLKHNSLNKENIIIRLVI